MSQFLLQMVISNTIAESRHLISAFGLDAADIMELLTQLEDLGFPKWNWGGIRLFGLGEGLVVVSENPLSEGDFKFTPAHEIRLLRISFAKRCPCHGFHSL